MAENQLLTALHGAISKAEALLDAGTEEELIQLEDALGELMHVNLRIHAAGWQTLGITPELAEKLAARLSVLEQRATDIQRQTRADLTGFAQRIAAQKLYGK
jgi:hypothetical protein